MANILKSLILLFLISPFIILIIKGGQNYSLYFRFFQDHFFLKEIMLSLKFTVFQSGLSAAISIIIGVISAFGLIRFKPKGGFFLEALVLSPSVLPAIFVITAGINIISFIHFPIQGLWPIVLIHSLMNIGLVAVIFSKILKSKASQYSNLPLIEGASPIQFIYHGVLKGLKKEVFYIFIFVFVICFTSFNVPIIFGGIYSTIEVLIYEKIRIYQNWTQAIALSLLQIVFLLQIISFFASGEVKLGVDNPNADVSWFSFPKLSYIPISITLLLLISLVGSSIAGIPEFSKYKSELLEGALSLGGSFTIAMGVGFFIMIMLNLILFLAPYKILDKFLISYVAPSTVICGFSLLLVDFLKPVSSIVLVIIGLTIMFLPSLYRLGGHEMVRSISRQYQTALVLGASRFFFFRKVIFYQFFKSVAFLSGIAAFWAVGDFALSSIVLESDYTLAMIIKSLLSSYKLELASLLIWILMSIGFLVYLIFWGLGFVVSKKSVF